MLLNPCSYCGAPAVEQIRGKYHKHNRDDVPGNHHEGALLVEMNAAIEDDFRIACSQYREHDYRKPLDVPKCNNAMGWNVPTIKVAEQMRVKWNADNPSSKAQFGI